MIVSPGHGSQTLAYVIMYTKKGHPLASFLVGKKLFVSATIGSGGNNAAVALGLQLA